jgi:hypothetical protein
MEVLNIEPVANSGDGGMRVIAFFDLQLSDDVRMYGLRLLEAPDGNRITYAPQSGSRRSATFARPLAERITAAASISLEAVTAHGTDSKI